MEVLERDNAETLSLRCLNTRLHLLQLTCGQKFIPHLSLIALYNLLFLRQLLCGKALKDLLLNALNFNAALGTAAEVAANIAKGGLLRPIVA